MTDGFAKDYRRTAEDIKPDFVSAKTEIEARVVAQGVVHATRTEVQALVFLNEYVTKDGGGDTTYTPYRALVTVVHTDRGWLVSALDTKRARRAKLEHVPVRDDGPRVEGSTP